MRWMLSVVLCACASAACAAPSVTASRWDTTDELPLWIERPNVPPDVVEMVRRAARSWSRASAGVLRFKDAAEFPSGGIRVRFVRDDENFGEAAPYLDRATGRIVRADVVLGMDPPGDDLQKRLVVYLSAVHELGHALGLRHTEEFGDVMYQFRRPADPTRYFLGYRTKLRSAEDIGSEAASGLSAQDVRALQQLYRP
jgi:Matrixin